MKASDVSVAWAEVDVDLGPASGVGVTHTTLLFSICLSAGCTATAVKEGGGTIAVTCGAVCDFAAKAKGKKNLPTGSDFVGVAAMRAVPPRHPEADGGGEPEGEGGVEAAGGGADGGAAMVAGGDDGSSVRFKEGCFSGRRRRRQ